MALKKRYFGLWEDDVEEFDSPVEEQIQADYVEVDDAAFPFSSEDLQDTLEKIIQSSSAADVFDAYNNVAITLTNAWQDIPLNLERKKTNSFAHTADSAEVTINSDDSMIVLAGLSTETTSGTSRSQVAMRLMVDTGSGYVEVIGSNKPMYNRQADYDSHGTFTGVLNFSAGDKIKLQGMIEEGTNTIVTRVGSNITMTGFRGEKGDEGLQGDTGVDGEDGQPGDTGEQGIQGDQGIQGPVGDTGDVGPQGPEGEEGAPAEVRSFTFNNISSVSCPHNLSDYPQISVWTNSGYTMGDTVLPKTFLPMTVKPGPNLTSSGWTMLTDNQYTVTNITDNYFDINFSSNLSGVVKIRN